MDPNTGLVMASALVGAAAFVATLSVTMELIDNSTMQAKWSVYAIFAAVAILAFIVTTVGALSATHYADFVPAYYTLQAHTTSPVLQVAAVLCYVALQVFTAPLIVVAGYKFTAKPAVPKGARRSLAAISMLLLSLVPLAGYVVLHIRIP